MECAPTMQNPTQPTTCSTILYTLPPPAPLSCIPNITHPPAPYRAPPRRILQRVTRHIPSRASRESVWFRGQIFKCLIVFGPEIKSDFRDWCRLLLYCRSRHMGHTNKVCTLGGSFDVQPGTLLVFSALGSRPQYVHLESGQKPIIHNDLDVGCYF